MTLSDWLNVLLLLGAVQGGFMALLLWKKKPSNVLAVQHLVYLLILVSALLSGRVISQYTTINVYASILLVPDVILFLIGPTIYFFVRSLLHQGLPKPRVYWRHFIPAFIHVFILNTLVALHLEQQFVFMTRNQIFLLFFLVEFGAMLHMMLYLIGSVQFFRAYQGQFYEKYAAEFLGEALRPHCIAGFILLGMWSIGIGANLIMETPNYTMYYLIWFLLVFSVYFLAFRILMSSQLLELPPLQVMENVEIEPMPEVPEVMDTPISDLQQEMEKLDAYMLQHKPFLSSEIKIGDLAKQLDIPRQELSRWINQGLQKNFFDFINDYRVQEFIQLRQSSEYSKHNTLELAFQAGFNSKSAFNRAFRKVTGHSPRSFFKNAPPSSSSANSAP